MTQSVRSQSRLVWSVKAGFWTLTTEISPSYLVGNNQNDRGHGFLCKPEMLSDNSTASTDITFPNLIIPHHIIIFLLCCKCTQTGRFLKLHIQKNKVCRNRFTF